MKGQVVARQTLTRENLNFMVMRIRRVFVSETEFLEQLFARTDTCELNLNILIRAQVLKAGSTA